MGNMMTGGVIGSRHNENQQNKGMSEVDGHASTVRSVKRTAEDG